jgi:CheY-like chemotaxis protein
MLERLIGTNVALRFELEDAGTVQADPSQLEQVILNLALNARDAMPHGGELTIALRGVELDEEGARRADVPAAGSYASLVVRDTGLGMDEETRQRAFEPYFTTKVGRGTGLGLSSVYGIARQSGGGVTAASSLGRGAAFTVLFPRVDARAPEPAEARATEEAWQAGRGLVLLVEDEDPVRRLVAETLRRTGYRVIEATSGAEAEQEFARNDGAVDLLLTDLMMPGEGGQALARRLRSVQPELKVIFISGHPGDSLGAEPAQAGTLIPKPFSLSYLTRVVGGVLSGEVVPEGDPLLRSRDQ